MKPEMSLEQAEELVWRCEDSGTGGDPECAACRGDGSVEVDEERELVPWDRVVRESGSTFKRCSCQDQIDVAYEVLARNGKRA